MHRAPVVLVLLALAGCAGPSPPEAVLEVEPRWVVLDPVVLVDGSFQWHETSTSMANALEYYDLASQAIAHPCVWEGSGGREPYFNNRQLPISGAGLGAWSGNVSFTLDWTETDWIGSALRIAYRAPGVDGWQETPPIERGSSLVEAIRVEPRNATADDEDAASGWSIWVCLPTDSGQPEQPFMGSFTAKAVFTPDPVLESDLGPAGNETGRKGRT
jgi:hypothetical protein